MKQSTRQESAAQTVTNSVRSNVAPARLAARHDPMPEIQHAAGNGAVAELLKEEAPAQPQTQRAVSDASAAHAPLEGERAPSIVAEVLRSPGQSLAPDTRAHMETHFGQSLERVRIHTDSEAAHSAAEVGALAYTVGSHIVFGDRQFAPETDVGRRLLAHELVHVVQQAESPAASSTPRIGTTGPHEREAESLSSGGQHNAQPRSVRERVGASVLLRQQKPPATKPAEPLPPDEDLLKPRLEDEHKPSPEERKELEAEERRLEDEARKGPGTRMPPRVGNAGTLDEEVRQLEKGAQEARRLGGVQRDYDELNRKLDAGTPLTPQEKLKGRAAEMQLDLGPELVLRLHPQAVRPHTPEEWEKLAKAFEHELVVAKLKLVRAKLGKRPPKSQRPPPPPPKKPPPPKRPPPPKPVPPSAAPQPPQKRDPNEPIA